MPILDKPVRDLSDEMTSLPSPMPRGSPDQVIIKGEQFEKYKKWLSSKRSTNSAVTTTTALLTLNPYFPDSDNSATTEVSWGLIIPIILIGIFLLAVATCLYWHNWRDKRRLRGESTVPNLSLSTFSRTFQTGNEWTKDFRSSTRSTTPLRVSVRDKATVHPIEFNQSIGDCLSDSMSSAWSRSTGQNGSIMRDGQVRYFQRRNLSPIDEMEPYVTKFLGSNNIASVSQYEGCVSSQNSMFSPYYLAWVSPQVRGPRRPNEDFNNNYTTSESSFYHAPKGSPYFPNHNTPTTECDSPSQQFPSKIINSLPTSLPTSYSPTPATRYPSSERSTDSSLTDQSGGTAIGAGSSLGYPGTSYAPGSSKCPSEPRSNGASDSSSLPSSANPFRQSNLSRMSQQPAGDRRNSALAPPMYESSLMQQSALNQPLASSIDSYTSSDNTSLYPNIGSSVNTSAHPLSLPSNPRSLEPSGYNMSHNGQGGYSTTSTTRSDDVFFDTAVSLQDGAPRTCLIHGDTSSIRANGSASIATALFRSWSANAQLDYNHSAPGSGVTSPMSAPPAPSTPNYFSRSRTSEGEASSNHNNLNKSHVESHAGHVVFQNIPPVLETKKYWL